MLSEKKMFSLLKTRLFYTSCGKLKKYEEVENFNWT